VIYDLDHRTVFSYAQSVSISHHVLHLAPRARPRQTCMSSAIMVAPAPTIRHESHDYFGNPVTYLTVQEPHRELQVHARARILVEAGAPAAPESSPAWEQVARLLETGRDAETLDAYQYAFDSPYVASDDEAYDFAQASFAPGRPVLAAAMDLTARIFEAFDYRGAVTDVSTPVREVLRTRKGVCQDFAHLEIACLRSHGLAARYVSGYLLTRPPAGKARMVGADASHAWVAVWCPGTGWVEFDPTNNLIPGDEHITLAWGRDYGDVSPINGFIVGGGEHEVAVAVDVVPVERAPG
jgi:transglutaminase-like putative cysteine protease